MSTPLFRYSYRPAVNIYSTRRMNEKQQKSRGYTHIESVVEVKIIVAIKVTSDELVDLGFGG